MDIIIENALYSEPSGAIVQFLKAFECLSFPVNWQHFLVFHSGASMSYPSVQQLRIKTQLRAHKDLKLEPSHFSVWQLGSTIESNVLSWLRRKPTSESQYSQMAWISSYHMRHLTL